MVDLPINHHSFHSGQTYIIKQQSGLLGWQNHGLLLTYKETWLQGAAEQLTDLDSVQFGSRKSRSSDGVFRRESCLQATACSGFVGTLSLSEHRCRPNLLHHWAVQWKFSSRRSRAVTSVPCVVQGRRRGWEGRIEQYVTCSTHELSHQMFGVDSEWLTC